jgi:hypothetical protein
MARVRPCTTGTTVCVSRIPPRAAAGTRATFRDPVVVHAYCTRAVISTRHDPFNDLMI